MPAFSFLPVQFKFDDFSNDVKIITHPNHEMGAAYGGDICALSCGSDLSLKILIYLREISYFDPPC